MSALARPLTGKGSWCSTRPYTPKPMAMDSAPFTMMEAESRREKAMPQARSRMAEPMPVSTPEAMFSMAASAAPPVGSSRSRVPTQPRPAATASTAVELRNRMSRVSRTLAMSSTRPYMRMEAK